MRTSLILTLLLLFNCEPAPPDTIELFNGQDLTGWHIDVPAMDTSEIASPFQAVGGSIISKGKPGGHLITNDTFRNYRLEFIYRFLDEPGNCGVLVHASTPRALYDMFPKSIEAQMMHLNAGDFWLIREDISADNMLERRGPKEEWGIVEGKKRRIKNLTDGSEKPLGEWNRMLVECLDDKIKVWVNGDFVNYGYSCTASSGQIALQSEGAKVEFRDIYLTKITRLSKD